MSACSDTLFLPFIPSSRRDKTPVSIWQRWGKGGGLNFTKEALNSQDHLVLADNIDLLRILPDECIDLVYIDPPFATGKTRESPKGNDGPRGFDDSIDDPQYFINWLGPRIRELWRTLSPNGNLVIHLDARVIHHVRLFCDREFGSEHWENEIIWHYTGGGRSKTRFSRKHDVLLWYSKGQGRVFNIDAVREPYEPTSGYAKSGIVSSKGKRYLPHPEGTPVDDVWDIPIVNPMSEERTAYPTQKPLKLLERIIAALSKEGQLIVDVFSGSGTTAVAARKLGRRFLCCDSNPDSIGITLERLVKTSPDYTPPSILSCGMFRIRVYNMGDSSTVAKRFCTQVLGYNESVSFESIQPIWRKNNNAVEPLSAYDLILKLNKDRKK